MRTRPALALSLTTLAAAAIISHAGPLTPPAGPVTPTHKTLTEIEPRTAISSATTPGDADSIYKITQPGSYYLTGNIAGVAAKHGIEIAAGGVTLDLMGFQLSGIAGSLHGVAFTLNSTANVSIRNGTISTWGGNGIDMGPLVGRGCAVEDIRITGNTVGMRAGANCVVARCQAFLNTSHGFIISTGSTVTSCTASENTANGFDFDLACVFADCAAFGNGVHGFDGNGANTFTACTAYTNDGSGFNLAGSGSTLTGCSAYSNSLAGFDCGASTITGCTAYTNDGAGISVSGSSTVSGCTSRANTGDGILATSGCLILGNTCSANGSGTAVAANIHTTGADNRIEGNACAGADIGIDVDAAGNIIIRNTCTGSPTNWSIAANNYYGAIVDRVGSLTPAVNGNAAGSAIATTDANANFTY